MFLWLSRPVLTKFSSRVFRGFQAPCCSPVTRLCLGAISMSWNELSSVLKLPDPINPFFVHFLVSRFHKNVLLIVQYRYRNPMQRMRWSRIWSSAQCFAVMVWLLIPVGWFVSTWSIWPDGKVLYNLGTNSQRASRRGWPLNAFVWFTGSGGLALFAESFQLFER